MHLSTRARVTLGSAAAAALALTLSAPAHADYGPTAGDVVGVGSDTVQNVQNFIDDGDNAQDAGFNSAGGVNRVVSFDATPDANDRALYGPGGSAAGVATPTIILRGGQAPIARPNGSGAGYTALQNNSSVSFARMSKVPANVTGFNNHAVKIAVDDLVMAVTSSTATPTNADTTKGIPASALYYLYTGGKTATGAALPTGVSCARWADGFNTVAATPATTAIVPLIPQTGSGTRSSFEGDLATAAAAAGVTPAPTAAQVDTAIVANPCVKVTEENDPAPFNETTTGPIADKVGPFSSGRKNLFDGNGTIGYFKDPSAAGNPVLRTNIQLLYGTATGSSQSAGACVKPAATANAASSVTQAYCNTRNLFIVLRDSDVTSTTAWQPGGSANWANTLFTTTAGQGTPYVNQLAGKTLIAAGGVTASYKDCGVNAAATC